MLKPRGAGSHRARSSHQFGVMLCARQAGAKHRGDLSDSPSQAKAKYQVREGRSARRAGEDTAFDMPS